MNTRATRYVILGYFADGRIDETLQANSRRADAVKRAKFIAADRIGWPSITRVVVRDTMPGTLAHVVCSFVR